MLARTAGVLALLAFFLVPNSARATAANPTPSITSNQIEAPISDLLIRATLSVLNRNTSNRNTLLHECSAAFRGDRVLINDLTLSGKLAPTILEQLTYGPACQVMVKRTVSPYRIETYASFRNAWNFPQNLTPPHKWLTSTGQIRFVPMMQIEKVLLSTSTYGNNRVVVLPFWDKRFALFLLTGPRITSTLAEEYFRSRAFRLKQGFQSSRVTMTMPRLSMSRLVSRCLSSCSVQVKQEIHLDLRPTGAGDAPHIPARTRQNEPGFSLIYARYRPDSPYVTLTLDHPFAFAIVDAATTYLLFTGWLDHPTLR
jgi:hypothetical protein